MNPHVTCTPHVTSCTHSMSVTNIIMIFLQAVSVFEGNAVCYYGDGQNYKKSVKLEGIGNVICVSQDC